MKKLLAASCLIFTAVWCWLFSAPGFAAVPLPASQLALYQGARHYPSELKPRGKKGFFYLPNRETYSSLGFNTKLIPPAKTTRAIGSKARSSKTSARCSWAPNTPPPHAAPMSS
jgi:hypothetical protein